MSPRLLLFCLFTFKSVCPSIVQSPAVVKVLAGGRAVLKCNLVDIMALCEHVSWYKLHPRTKELKQSSVVINGPGEKKGLCLGIIYNTTGEDSGAYYCSAAHSIILYTGNGSRLIVKEPSSQPTVELYVSEERDNQDLSLQCVVMGVTPVEVCIHWDLKHSKVTGWIESGWRDDSDSASEFTRAHITFPPERGVDEVECVVELDGKTFSQTLKRGEVSYNPNKIQINGLKCP
ncbi:titin-like [Hoplias malabaricus]|uniref:titin-like n=1 Tax=Hoplias malabaricus TaxID=27720 RepID=UPI0034627F9F